MSATALAPVSLSRTLRDYELHLTGDSQPPESLTPVPASARISLAAATRDHPFAEHDPVNWPSNFRGVPPYRPINRNLDISQRPAGGNGVESFFLMIMFCGVILNAVRRPLIWSA
jgi:hypothetical protein